MNNRQTLFVTGASGALGQAVVHQLLAQGYSVIGTYFESEPENLPSHPELNWLSLDLSQAQAVHDSITTIVTKFGPVDGLVHCAGGFRWAKIENTTDDEIEFLINANLKSAIFMVRALIPMMKERNFGRIILIGSRSAILPGTGISVYAATKAALSAFVTSVAEEVRDYNININALLPTIIDTPANRADMPAADFKTWVSTDQLAKVIGSLLSDAGTPINGAHIEVAGRL